MSVIGCCVREGPQGVPVYLIWRVFVFDFCPLFLEEGRDFGSAAAHGTWHAWQHGMLGTNLASIFFASCFVCGSIRRQ